MKNQKVFLNINAKIKPIKPLNPQLTLCKCYVHALDKNDNMSYFSKENVDRNIGTLDGIPVIGHLIKKSDSDEYFMGSHDEDLKQNDDGSFSVETITIPYGFVYPRTSNYEVVQEKDGTFKTYIVADIILWTGRSPDLMSAIYSDDVYFNQSMEVEFSNAEPLKDDENYLNIIDYTYTALCLLGKSDNPDFNTIPCFPSSCVKPYTFALDERFKKEMQELKNIFNEVYKKKEGEEMDKSVIEKILVEYGIKAEDIPFEITADMTEEDFRKKLDEIKTGCGKKKCSLENDNINLAKIELLEAQYKALQEEFTTYKEMYSVPNSEVDELKTFKTEKLQAEHKSEMESVLSEFEDLKENTEFIALSAKAVEYETADALRNACYIIRGKSVKTVGFSKDATKGVVKVPCVEDEADSKENQPYGGFLSKYFNKE